MTGSIILGITGASGSAYALRLLEVLATAGYDVHLSISPSGAAVLRQELGVEIDVHQFRLADLFRSAAPADSPQAGLHRATLRGDRLEADALARVRYHAHDDFLAPIASGSFLAGGMVVCPCSGTTLSAIAHAAAGNLIQRAAEVQLKERRKLILVPRETPLSLLQLENMQRVTRAGAVVLPASPGWYHGVRDLADLVDFVVARICDQLGVANRLIHRWGEVEE
jgi:4-hydroxy-3-polyprenylbenzoate decarboxylase